MGIDVSFRELVELTRPSSGWRKMMLHARQGQRAGVGDRDSTEAAARDIRPRRMSDPSVIDNVF